jgi:hypothetical protein
MLQLKRGRPETRTPPGSGAVLISIRDQADERGEYSAGVGVAQAPPRILAMHWFRDDELREAA